MAESTSEAPSSHKEEKPWHVYTAEQAGDLKRTVIESTSSALRSARSLQENSSSHLKTLQGFIPQVKLQYKVYEDAFFNKFKEELKSAREHPTAAVGISIAAGLLLMRGPRRFLFRHTVGRLRSEEAIFVTAEKNVKELGLSVDMAKKESKKLLERASLAEDEMKRGHTKLKHAGSEIQRLAHSVYKIESQAAELMDELRETPGREALKLRAEVASMASIVKQQRIAMDKRILKISELGVPV